MFTPQASAILDGAKRHAVAVGRAEVDPADLLAALRHDPATVHLLAEAAEVPTDRVRLASAASDRAVRQMPVAAPLQAVFAAAREFAQECPDTYHPGAIDVRHLIVALLRTQSVAGALGVRPLRRDQAVDLLNRWADREGNSPRLSDLTRRLAAIRAELLSHVFGQEHAVAAFVEGLFNAELTAAADLTRVAPRAVFVFAGPPGVGKTLLASRGAGGLDRPFRRFDMSSYSSPNQADGLAGMPKSFMGAQPGALTEFVAANPFAVLLFDEIERAHPRVIQLFLQVLDAGVLEDRYYEKNVPFRDTTIVFTTNAGRRLYDRKMANVTGVHRRTLLDALGQDRSPETGEPIFPPAICSRLATGYPVLFNRLGVNELERVARAELHRQADLFGRQYGKAVTFDDLVPLCLVLREGVEVDARALRAQAEAFFKSEIHKVCELFRQDGPAPLESTDTLRVCVDDRDSQVKAVFTPTARPRVLLVADRDRGERIAAAVPEVDWHRAVSAADAGAWLDRGEVDYAVVDLWLGGGPEVGYSTIRQFDIPPATARRFDDGREALRLLHDRASELPVFLLASPDGSADDELMAAVLRTGTARGVIDPGTGDQPGQAFAEEVLDVAQRLHRETVAHRLGHERKVLAFDTTPGRSADGREGLIRLRRLRLSRAVAASDLGEVLDDVARPTTRFADVIGADTAKAELRFVTEHLKDPRRLAALGLKPPKGVLLHGPPGTGKTMLARAVAGESDVAFLAATATSFVTVWQGSGPENVRQLFARARRYAPAVVFLDEIDAIGRVRTGSPGGGEATENTLNALLTEMDGFTSDSPARPVFVLAATNFRIDADPEHPERSTRTLDPALVRRFSRVVLVELPDRAARRTFLTLRLTGRAGFQLTDAALDTVTERTAGMSIADLEGLVEAATRVAVRTGRPVGDRDLIDVTEQAQFGDTRPRSADDILRTARHEAGHVVLYWLSGRWPAYVTVVSRGQHGGYMASSAEDVEGRTVRTADHLLADIRVSLGGRAAEVLHYGPAAGRTTGAVADLELASRLARDVVGRFGMADDFGLLVASPDHLLADPLLAGRVNAAAGRILSEAMAETTALLRRHQAALEVVTSALVRDERLTAEGLKQLLGSPPA